MLACMRVHIVMCDCVDCRGLHGILFHGLSMGYPSMDCRGLHGIPFHGIVVGCMGYPSHPPRC